MTTRYCGPGGNDGNSGLTWALRKLTLTGCEDTPVVAGDVVYVGPGVYRETLTCDVSGGNTYSTGTVSVTNGSDQVTGAGTAWLASVAADYMFHVRYYDNGADGVTNGTSTFTAAGGNFQANMVGVPIQINTKGAYTIATVVSATEITLADPNGLGWPTAGSSLTYSVMSGEGHYDIESVDADGTLTLKQPWQGRTLTGLSYLTFNPITYIGDVTGENTDGVGGAVRITGSDNDQTLTRSYGILVSGDDYRVFRGFRLDICLAFYIGSDHIIIEDCFGTNVAQFVNCDGDYIAHTVRRCVAFLGTNLLRWSDGAVTRDDRGHVIENSLLLGSRVEGIFSRRIGGITVRNCFFSGFKGLDVETALTTGQTVAVTNCIFQSTASRALEAATLGEIIENYNTFYLNATDRLNVVVGAGSVSYPSIVAAPILHAGADQLSGFRFPPPLLGELSEWSQIAAIAGVDERNTDLFGIRRPATAAKNSWGAVQFADMERETGTVHAGSVSMVLHDAGRHQIWVPVANESTTISVYVYREANYAGTNPQMIVKQPGQADDITTDAAAASQWNQLTTTLTPAANPPYVVVELISNNTAAAGNFDCFFDDLVVS